MSTPRGAPLGLRYLATAPPGALPLARRLHRLPDMRKPTMLLLIPALFTLNCGGTIEEEGEDIGARCLGSIVALPCALPLPLPWRPRT